MDVKRFVIILSGVVLIAFGIGIFSLRYNDNIGPRPLSISRGSSFNVKSSDSNVRVGWDGIDVKDGDDHVQVGWDGIKVKDGNDEINVGWNGVKIKEGSDVRFDLFSFSSWFGFGNRNLETADIDEQKNIELEGIENINLSSPFIDIKISSEDRDDICINYHGRIRSNVIPTLEVKENGNTLNIELKHSKNSYTITESNLVLEVLLPTSFNGNIDSKSSSGDISIRDIAGGTFDISASSGDIKIDNLQGKKMDIESSSGNMYLKDIAGDDLDISAHSGDITLDYLTGNKIGVKTSSGIIYLKNITGDAFDISAHSGDITLDHLTGNELEVKTSSGIIKIKDATGKFDLSTNSGDIALDNGENYDDYKISTSSGNAEIKLPYDANYTITGSSSSGRYSPSADMNVVKNDRGDFKATMGAGTNSIDINTNSGDVRFR